MAAADGDMLMGTANRKVVESIIVRGKRMTNTEIVLLGLSSPVKLRQAM